jgi:uncharacterized membrane protein
MKTIFRELVFLMIAFSPTIGALLLYKQLPDTMATHFGAHNEVDGTMSKQTAILVIAIIGFVPFLMLAVRRFDPRLTNEPKFSVAFQAIRFCLVLLLAFAGWSIVTYNLGYTMDIRKIVFIALAVLFLITGNYLSIIKPNYMIGIRTPWTLTDDENWRKTHRLGGPVMVIGGLIILVAAFLPVIASIIVFIGSLAIITFVPIGYSFILFIRKHD